MRYIKQTDDSTCVPVALMNLAKWAGYKVTLENHLDIFKRAVNWKGTTDQLSLCQSAMILPGVSIYGVCHTPSISTFISELKLGHSALFKYIPHKEGSESAHVAFCAGITGHRINVINGDHHDPTIATKSNEEITEWSERYAIVEETGRLDKSWAMFAARNPKNNLENLEMFGLS